MDKVRKLVLDLIYDYGMQKILESMIDILGEPTEEYLVTLKKDLTVTLKNYNNRYKEEA